MFTSFVTCNVSFEVVHTTGCIYLFDHKYNKSSNYYNLNELLLEFIPVMQSWIFSIITPVIRVTWPCRNDSNMLIWCSRNISDYYQCWKQLRCFIFFFDKCLCCHFWATIILRYVENNVFLKLKPCKHCALHQIMIFIASSYDPFKLLNVDKNYKWITYWWHMHIMIFDMFPYTTVWTRYQQENYSTIWFGPLTL